MAKKPESRLQRRIRDRLEKEVGGWWFKVWGGPFQAAGIPDLLGCVDGIFFAFEVKMPGETPSELQKLVMRDMKRKGGAVVAVVETPEEALEIVREHLRKA